MKTRFLGLLLISTLLCGIVGVAAHGGDQRCPMANMDCCKKAQSSDASPEASMARLCCNLNCSEPGSSGANNASSFSNQPGLGSTEAAVPSENLCNRLQVSAKIWQPDNLHHQAPKYIQHLALLI
ncbi:MAG TPA: hypothetical protein VN643_27540 [Pyrinomonadaceae bacterium]|nr:hypothetical protein [Pyrinomonadaceae bacterium]